MMKRTPIALTLVFALFATADATAGVQEKKELRAAKKKMEKTAEKAKASCGNAELKPELDISQYEKYAYESGNDKATYYRFIQGHVENFFLGMAKACEDADYKAEIQKITKVRFVGHEKEDVWKHDLELKGTTIVVKMAPQYSNSVHENMKKIRGLF